MWGVGVYVFGASYLIAPYLGWHLDVASMAAAFGSLPVAAKLGIKSFIAFPFAFHSINGLRHLTWDTGAGTPLPNCLGARTDGVSVEE
jgi:succinate dehydrogenase (ubiquinone) cytochrome b560 subunit